MLTKINPCIKTCKDNEEYIELGCIYDVYGLLYDGASSKVKTEIEYLLNLIRKYEMKNTTVAKDIAIRKDNVLGNYIINLSDEVITNLDNEVYFDKVVNALNIAIFENNPIAKDLVPLFQRQISGSKATLVAEYGLEVIEYILKNDNFATYLEKVNGEYLPKEYLVYEDKQLVKQIIISTQNQKIKI